MDVTKRAGNEFKKCCAKLGAPVAPLRMNPRVVRWFTPGLHVKRWLVLLMVGMVLVSLGIGYALANFYRSGVRLPAIFYYLTLQFMNRYVRGALFGALGLSIILYALYKLTQSVLGPFLPGRDRALSEIIYNYRFLQKGPRVVAMGRGTGLSTLLRGLKQHTGNLTAIVTVADDGGSSGRLRRELRILPPGDFRQCIAALADVEPLMGALLRYRFGEGSGLEGHNLGNLLLAAMADITGNFELGLREMGHILAVQGQILPSTLEDVLLVAELHDKSHVHGESNMHRDHASPDVDLDGRSPIERVFLTPANVVGYREAVQAILDADVVVVGPGSLYTSVMPNLLVKDIAHALAATAACKV